MRQLMLDITTCDFCDKKAEVVYTLDSLFVSKLRILCKEHSRLYKIIKKD